MITRRFRFIKPSREYRELLLLTEIDRSSCVSQRSLSKAAHVSSTMVNTYVSELESRGLLEVNGTTNRSVRYRLTPLGQQTKNELFFLVSREIIQFYGVMKAEFSRRLREHHASGIRRVVLFGAAETAELVYNAAKETGIEVIGIVDNDPQKHGKKLGDLVIMPPSAIPLLRPEAVLITSFGHMDEIYEQNKRWEREGIAVRCL